MERAIRRALRVTALAACAALAALTGGCAASGTTARGTAPAPARGTTTARPAPAPAATPRQRAVADAAAILTAFVPPPGARRLAKAPATDGGLLRFPSSSVVSSALVDDASFWLTPGQPPAVLGWEQAHLPGRFTPGDQDFGPPSWDRMFSLPPVPGVLTDRELVVEVIAAGGGQTAIRADAQVAWQPVRPPGEHVPSAARVVTVAAVPGAMPGTGPPPAPVTVTSAAVVARLAALVDGLRLSTIGVASCPAFLAPGVRLTFRARLGGPPLAVAEGPAPCGIVVFTVGGRQQPALQVTSGFVGQVLAIAGLRWRLS